MNELIQIEQQIQAIQNRIKEFKEFHFVIGGTHIESMGKDCPTCKIIIVLQGLEKQYLKNQKTQLEN